MPSHPVAVPRTFSFQPRTASHLHAQPSHAYPHRRRRRLWNLCQTLATYFLILLVLVCLLASLIDIGDSFVRSNRTSKVADLSITAGTYVAIIVFGLTIIISRTFSNRRAITAIPKGYLPTRSADVPKRAHELIQNEYERACIITKVSQPSGRDQAGWGRPGSSCEDVYFRSAILSTIPTLRSALLPLFPHILSAYPSPAPRSAPLSPLAPLLALPDSDSPLPAALRPLAELYESKLVLARYAKDEPSEGDWEECAKAVAVFVGVLSRLDGG